MDLEVIKSQLRVDGNSDDAYITELMAQAQEFIIGAVDSSIPLETYEQYTIFDRACEMLIATWYFYRMDVSETQLYKAPYGVEMMINQLRGKLWGDSDESDS